MFYYFGVLVGYVLYICCREEGILEMVVKVSENNSIYNIYSLFFCNSSYT